MKKDILAAIDEALAVGNRIPDIEEHIFDVYQHVVLLEKALIGTFGPDWDPEDEDVLGVVETSTQHAFNFWSSVESCWNCSQSFLDHGDAAKYKLGMCLSCYNDGYGPDEDPTDNYTEWGEVDGIPIMRSTQTYKQHMFVFIGEAHPFR